MRDRYTWPTRRQAQAAIFGFIEGFYNRQRRHSILGHLPPATFEAGWYAAASVASRNAPPSRGTTISFTDLSICLLPRR